MEHNYYNGLSMLLLCFVTVHYVGTPMGKYLEKEVNAYESAWNKSREDEKQLYEEQIFGEKEAQVSMTANEIIVGIKREVVHIQQEAEYRKRFMHVYEAVMQRLMYHTQIDKTKRKVIKSNLIDWISTEIYNAITSDWDKMYNDYCIDLLDKMPRVDV